MARRSQTHTLCQIESGLTGENRHRHDRQQAAHNRQRPLVCFHDIGMFRRARIALSLGSSMADRPAVDDEPLGPIRRKRVA